MAKNTAKARDRKVPVEEHNTASWANIERSKPVSNVTMPGETQVTYAKEYVDTNEK